MKKVLYISDVDDIFNWDEDFIAYEYPVLALINSKKLKKSLDDVSEVIFTVEEYKHLLCKIVLRDKELEAYEYMNMYKKKKFLREKINEIKKSLI